MTIHVTSFVFQAFGVRRQSGAATALWHVLPGRPILKRYRPSVATTLIPSRILVVLPQGTLESELQTSKPFGMIRPAK